MAKPPYEGYTLYYTEDLDPDESHIAPAWGGEWTDAAMTAHMQLHRAIATSAATFTQLDRGDWVPYDADRNCSHAVNSQYIVCGGTFQNGEFGARQNSLYNHPEFREIMNDAEFHRADPAMMAATRDKLKGKKDEWTDEDEARWKKMVALDEGEWDNAKRYFEDRRVVLTGVTVKERHW